jgi:hypothetical protein
MSLRTLLVPEHSTFACSDRFLTSETKRPALRLCMTCALLPLAFSRCAEWFAVCVYVWCMAADEVWKNPLSLYLDSLDDEGEGEDEFESGLIAGENDDDDAAAGDD